MTLSKDQTTPIYSSQSYFINDQFVTEHTPAANPRGVYVLLHGFPAWVSKNYDIGEQLALLGYKVYIPHHRGLGQSKGTFRFDGCIQDTRSFITLVKTKHPDLPLSLVGHSWGGYLALRHLNFISSRLILLAPLAQFPTEPERQQALISNLYQVNHDDLSEYTLETLASEFRSLKHNLDLSILRDPARAPQTLLLYGTNDETIPADLMSDFASSVASSTFETVVSDDDHRLSKRRPVLNKIRDWVSGQ
jgi:pimeloyl-ACP methyl ester carboxylesterase